MWAVNARENVQLTTKCIDYDFVYCLYIFNAQDKRINGLALQTLYSVKTAVELYNH